ncbi:MAG: hypothetical protein KBD52_01955 [Candidatus Pacebacteria bacterium]|nr:hypothetical protein [Candidatus Paceibacterota bacterium]
MYVTKKSEQNPILTPNRDHYWESFATFNLCPIKKGNTIYGFYRALSAVDHMQDQKQISIIGMGKSKDGIHFTDRKQFLLPKEEWDLYGCEDPRVTYFEGKYYIFYTALSIYPFGPEGIKVAVAVSKDLEKVDSRHFVTPFNAKAMTLFPERVNGKIVVVFSAHTDTPHPKMAVAYLDKIEELWSHTFWKKWEENMDNYIINPKRNSFDHVEVGAPPIKTKYGWLLVYSHIQNYFRTDENSHLDRIFGIEALLLDLKDPQKIIGRTRGPILVPEEPYELSGYISNVVFPSGALIKKDKLVIYYGASDTTASSASVDLKDLIFSMHPKYAPDYFFKRAKQNPILKPIPEHSWEAQAVFNPAAIDLGGKVHILYRAFSSDNTSYIGYANSKNGVDIVERFAEPIYLPREDFEKKKIENGFSGCEDPRLTKIGNNLYMCYTAYDSVGPPRVAITSISEKDFLEHKWNWSKPALITPRDMDDKDTCIFPEKLKDGYLIAHRVGGEICGDYIHSLDFEKEEVKKCIRIIGPRINTWDSAKVGIASPPIKTKYGWILLYHGVSKSHNTYRVGAVLLDLKDPAIVLARTTEPIFEPEMDYEKNGFVNNVVFPCGIVVRKGLVYIYYGGADKVVGVATMKLDILLKALKNGVKY